MGRRKEVRQLEAAFNNDPLAAHTIGYQIGYVIGVVVGLGLVFGLLTVGFLSIARLLF